MKPPHLQIRAATDVGLRRSHNEDHHGWWLADGQPGDEEIAVLVVADGMGGANAGEVASQIAVHCVLEGCREHGRTVSLKDLAAAVEKANHTVYEQGLEQPDQRGMGTTCTALLISGNRAWQAHVGDSRIYLLRDGKLKQLTRDHSLVAQLVEGNHLTPEQARQDPRRNVVTRCLGAGPTVDIDLAEIEGGILSGDTFLLCTDGLHGVVDDRELHMLAGEKDLGKVCYRSIDLARDRGGPDNITLIVMRAGGIIR
jgi:protein phosphatase